MKLTGGKSPAHDIQVCHEDRDKVLDVTTSLLGTVRGLRFRVDAFHDELCSAESIGQCMRRSTNNAGNTGYRRRCNSYNWLGPLSLSRPNSDAADVCTPCQFHILEAELEQLVNAG